jgi:type II secretory pathway pseudopilin PulG
MSANRLTSSAGFTLIAAMVAVTIIGILLGATGQSWKMFMKREREVELLFRGMQYRNAITRWYNPNLKPGVSAGVTGAKAVALAPTTGHPLRDLKFLLQDPGSAGTVRYLRKLYTDPITGKDFVPVLDANQNIIGVASSSEDAPLKIGNFPEELKVMLSDKKKYNEWKFVYTTVPPTAAGTSQVTGLPPIPK